MLGMLSPVGAEEQCWCTVRTTRLRLRTFTSANRFICSSSALGVSKGRRANRLHRRVNLVGMRDRIEALSVLCIVRHRPCAAKRRRRVSIEPEGRYRTLPCHSVPEALAPDDATELQAARAIDPCPLQALGASARGS